MAKPCEDKFGRVIMAVMKKFNKKGTALLGDEKATSRWRQLAAVLSNASIERKERKKTKENL